MDKTKTPKTLLKEMEQRHQNDGAKLKEPIFRDTIDESKLGKPKIFFCTCEFLKVKGGRLYKGEGVAPIKKLAEHEACQQILDMMSLNEAGTIRNVQAGLRVDQIDDDRVNVTSGPSSSRANGSKKAPSISRQLFNEGNTYVIRSEPVEPSHPSINSEVTVIASEGLPLDSPSILEQALKGNKIGELQEFCVKNKLNAPTYIDTQWTAPDKTARYKVVCTVGKISKEGVSQVKIQAKKISALKVLSVIQNENAVTEICGSSIMLKNVPSKDAVIEKVTEKIVYYPQLKMGEGATAQVYQGYFEIPTKRAAVKISPKEVVHHDKNKELDILRKVTHPNIVTYYTTEDIGTLTYIVMELAQSTLEDVIKSKQPIDPQILKKFCTDCTTGLIALHESRIVHRDLKPSNVLIFPGNVAKLADFGISKELESILEGVVTEAFKGTRIWMPPEGLRAIGSPIPFTLLPSFDIFSLGLTIFYTMINGNHLFASPANDSPVQIQSNIINMNTNWSLIASNEYTALRNVLKSMISSDPKKRPDGKCVMEHPFFWDDRKGLEFVFAVSNDLKNNQINGSESRTELASLYIRYCGQSQQPLSWKSRLHPKLQDFIRFKEQMKLEKKGNPLTTKIYKETTLIKLIEFIRDYHQHYEDWNTFEFGVLKHNDIFGDNGSKYGQYFLRVFPELTTLLYTLFQDRRFHGLQLQPFYALNTEGCYERL